MSGTKQGGLKAAKTNRRVHGSDFYKVIGAKGGAAGTTGGFYYSKVHGIGTHIEAGRKGGLTSRRAGVKNGSHRVIEEPKSRIPLLKRLLKGDLWRSNTN